MRIISGINKGRRIKAPKNLPVRPTTDMAKESLFNILYNYYNFEDCTVLDLFAGTGNITYEFVSRECVSIYAVDIEKKCVDFMHKTIEELKCDQVRISRASATQYLQTLRVKFDIIFADPPYNYKDYEGIINLIFERELLKEGGMLVIEHSQGTKINDHPNFFESRTYGKVNFSFFKKED